jgi:thymidylate synthase ThyX
MSKANTKNTVELMGTYGSDETHALSAWTSTSRQLGPKKRARMGKLLDMLAREGHHTPFEKSSLHFLITTDIATHIHLLKHRAGVNCVTGDTEIYIPKPSGGVRKVMIKDLYDQYENGILSKSKNGKEYRRQYGRPVRCRTKEDDSNLVKKGYISKVFYNGKSDVYKFTTKSGRTISTTLDHKFYSRDGGFVEIGEYLGVEVFGSKATISNVDNMVAVNGININVSGKPYTFRDWWAKYEGKYTRKEVAKISGYKYELIKKWGYIHDVIFLKDMNKDFKPGNIPWNKGKYGYKLNRQKNGINPNINPDLDYKIWRATVGNWTREQMPALLSKFNYVCQAQIDPEGCSRDFVCHHVIPVSVDKTRATDYNNLAPVCSGCHKKIHSSRASEEAFAQSFLEEDVKGVFKKRKPRKGRRLAFDYEQIVSVEHLGVQDVYDLEVDGTHNYVANGFLIHNCNAESARYKEFIVDKYYLPVDWPESERENLEAFIKQAYENYHSCIARLEEAGYSRKRAKESARFYLPYGIQITCDIMFNWRSFAHFQKLRNDEHAQLEVRQVAQEMLRLVEEQGDFPMTIHAMRECGMLPGAK